MRLHAYAVVLAGLGFVLLCPATAVRAADTHVHGCMTPGQARDVLIARQFVAPFRAAGEATRSQQGETVGLQLCQRGEVFVYDVTLLRRDGRVSHVLVDARSGTILADTRGGK